LKLIHLFALLCESVYSSVFYPSALIVQRAVTHNDTEPDRGFSKLTGREDIYFLIVDPQHLYGSTVWQSIVATELVVRKSSAVEFKCNKYRFKLFPGRHAGGDLFAATQMVAAFIEGAL